MQRRVFFSYHYKLDDFRVSQIRDAGTVASNSPASDDDWDVITRGGDPEIQRWIDGQCSGRCCAVVLIGPATAGRKWIDYEIRKAWEGGMGLMGIHIHNLKDRLGNQTAKGENPFTEFSFDRGATRLSTLVQAYDPPYTSSPDVREYIGANIASWVEKAIAIRNFAWTQVRAEDRGLAHFGAG